MMINKAGKILSVSPQFALPGGEIVIECRDFQVNFEQGYGCFFDGQKSRLVAASPDRVIAIVPEGFDTHEVEIYLESGADRSESVTITVAKELVKDLHIVANPAVDPKDDSIILTRSGSRGQSLPVTLFRLEPDGYLQEMATDILNPTGIAFDPLGQLFVSNRAEGVVLQISADEHAVDFASGLGVVTGIAFNKQGVMYVGDRKGSIFRVSDFGIAEVFATLEPSVSAYHLAFDDHGDLFVTAPGLSSFDGIYRIGIDGKVSAHFRGLGRPQGLAFDQAGNLYVAACHEAKRGIVRIAKDGSSELLVAGMNVIGLCFNRKGDLIVATNDSAYSIPMGIKGNLLN